jgi:hypothetical protein
MTRLFFVLSFFLLLLLPEVSFAATRYAAATGNWNSTSTWSATPGGAPGASVPGIGDDVVFVFVGGPGPVTVTVTADASCGSIDIQNPTTTGDNILFINNGVTLTVIGNVDVHGQHTSSGSSRDAKLISNGGTLTVGGNLTMGCHNNQEMTFDLSNGTNASSVVNVAGTFTNTVTNRGKFTPGTNSTINFNGTSPQVIEINGVIKSYANITINNPAGVTLTANMGATEFTGNLRVQSGILNNGGFAITGSGGTFEVANGAQFVLTGTSAFPTGFGTVTLGATSTVNYSGTGAQTVAAQNYGNLTISGARGANNVTLASSGTIGVAGILTDTATFNSGNGFVTTGSTVNYNGTGSQSVTALSPLVAGNSTYNNLTISNTASAVSASTSFSVGGNFTVNASAIFAPTSAVVISGAGTLTGSGTVQVTRATGSTDFTSQYTITNKTLTNLTVEFAGAAAQGAGANTFGGLKINNSSGVTLSGNATVNGTLTLASGNITTSSNKVIISSTGSVSRTSGHVVGNLQKNVATGATSKTFEVGDASNYTPASVSFASVTTAGDLTASTTAGDHPNISSSTINSSKSVNRYWTLTNSGIVFTNYSATFNFVSGDVDAGAGTDSFIVGRYGSATWTYPTVGTKTSTSTQATGLTAFSDFEVGEQNTPSVALVKSVTPLGTQPPGTDLTYTVTFTNSDGAAAQSLVIADPIPANTDFKVGSVTNNLGTTGLTVAVEYSNDGGTTWTYTPASGGGGAPAGYDRNVTNIRWTFTGNLSQTSPNNTGSVTFTSLIR